MAKAAKTVSDYEDSIAPSELNFDGSNPRLVEFLEETASPTQDDLLKVLWEEMAVDELVLSISKSGYLPFEPLLVANEQGKWIVIEGNRRLAAVKILVDEGVRKKLAISTVPKLTKAAEATLSQIPVIKTTRKESWRYLGVKHINGPKKWDSYAKAQYIANVADIHNADLSSIAEQIGDKHNTVQRLYRALKVIEQAEKAKVFNRSSRAKKHFAFSHLYTGLDYENIASFIGLKDESLESAEPVDPKKLKNLGEFCVWLFGDATSKTEPLVQSQNPHLRQLNEVLGDKQAIAALRAKLPLTVALEVSYGDEKVFSDALQNAKNDLQKARATVTTGFHGDPEQVFVAEDIADLARDLLAELKSKLPRKRSRS